MLKIILNMAMLTNIYPVVVRRFKDYYLNYIKSTLSIYDFRTVTLRMAIFGLQDKSVRKKADLAALKPAGRLALFPLICLAP